MKGREERRGEKVRGEGERGGGKGEGRGWDKGRREKESVGKQKGGED